MWQRLDAAARWAIGERSEADVRALKVHKILTITVVYVKNGRVPRR